MQPAHVAPAVRSVDEVAATFLAIEDELGLLDREVCGLRAWERIRAPLWGSLVQRLGVQGQFHEHLSRIDSLRLIANGFRHATHITALGLRPADIVFFGHPRRQLLSDGRWWDLYCDPILPHITRSYTYFERAYLGTHYRPAATKRRRYLDTLTVAMATLRGTLSRVVSLSQADIAWLSQVDQR